jgi:hypothetical protein
MSPARAAQHRGRDIASLLADFGHHLPVTRPVLRNRPDPNPFGRVVPRRGRPGRGAGWSPVPAPLSTWRMTSEQTPVLWPFIASSGLPPTGAQMGIDVLSGGAFYCDPMGWVNAPAIPVTNPNMFVFGKPGRGKSATVKVFCLRMLPYGYRVLVLGDIKDEYEPLCRALEVEPFVIGHGLPTRVNPLAFGPLGHDWARIGRAEAQRRAAIIFSRWLILLRGLVGSQRSGGRPVPFGPSDETVVSEALRLLTGYTTGATRLTESTIPQLWQLLDEPAEDLVYTCRYADRRQFLDETRTLRDALRLLVKGHLAGLFDDHTTIDVDWRAPIQSLSLSRLEPLGDEAVGIALTCVNSWGQAMREIAEPGDLRIVIRDETWRQMRLGAEAVKSLDANLRLSRKDADVQVLLAHKPSDMLTAGDTDSQTTAIAKDLLHLCDVRVLHGQDQRIGEELATVLGLNTMARHVVTNWAMADVGRALWLVGERLFKVQTVRTPLEESLTYTNDAIASG